MLKIMNETKAMIVLPNKVTLQVGENHLVDKVWEEAKDHKVVAQMVKDKKISEGGKVSEKAAKAAPKKEAPKAETKKEDEKKEDEKK